MTSLITALFLASSFNVAEAHRSKMNVVKHRSHHARQQAYRRPAPPPRVTLSHTVRYHRGHWVYPHSNPGFLWKWKPGHYTARGAWVPGHWRVVVRL